MSHTKTLQENVYTRKRKRLKVEQPVFKKYFALQIYLKAYYAQSEE